MDYFGMWETCVYLRLADNVFPNCAKREIAKDKLN